MSAAQFRSAGQLETDDTCFQCAGIYLAVCTVGTMMGITNTVATLPGFIGPTVVGALTYRNVSIASLTVSPSSANLNRPLADPLSAT